LTLVADLVFFAFFKLLPNKWRLEPREENKGKNTTSGVTGVLFSSGGRRRGASSFNYVLASFMLVFPEFSYHG
jgi:hypothetical protein